MLPRFGGCVSYPRTGGGQFSDAFVGKLQPMQLAPAVVAFPNATALSCKEVERELLSEEFHCIGQLKQLTILELYNKAILEAG